MTLTFLTNLVNHHQICVADELYGRFKEGYVYVAFEPLPEWLRKGGYQEIERPYILKAYESEENRARAEALAYESDVVIIGSASEKLVRRRLQENKITFHYNERWFKRISYHLLSPRLWKRIFCNHIRYRNKPSYMLCASAFTAPDARKVFAYPGKCFKWGYFTRVDDFNLEASLAAKRGNTRIMWCARFLDWKHPELPVKLARRLKDTGYDFRLDMYGSGVELERTKELAGRLGVEDVVAFKGNLPNEEILQEMRGHNIFLFTSDRNEGWGAVLNEAMSNGCAVVASDKIGSVPFLVKDRVNGLVFKSEDLDSLTSRVRELLDVPTVCEDYARAAYRTMREEWSPRNAAGSLVNLIGVIMAGRLEEYKKSEGPCSWAR